MTIPTDSFDWLAADAIRVVTGPTDLDPASTRGGAAGEPDEPPATANVNPVLGMRLSALDQIRSGQHSVRVGWLFLTGRTASDDSRTRRVFHTHWSALRSASSGRACTRLVGSCRPATPHSPNW